MADSEKSNEANELNTYETLNRDRKGEVVYGKIKGETVNKWFAFCMRNALKLIILLVAVNITISVTAIAIFAKGYAALNTKVHSNWNSWLSWEVCSVSCSVGIQSRRRTCSSSQPNLNADVCQGESADYRTCTQEACSVHGNWNSWLSWEVCSVSCGVGIQSRRRTCSSLKSNAAAVCQGESADYRTCTQEACADGGWSDWGVWKSCSVTCGGGIRSRMRSCSNPRPSIFGRFCDGSPEQVESCFSGPCPGSGDSSGTGSCGETTCAAYSVAFTATYFFNESSATSIKFQKIQVNYGNAYSSATGEFTCRIPGLYSFSTTLSRYRKQYGNVHAYLTVRASGSSHISHLLTLFSQVQGAYSLSASGTYHLNQNDVVYVRGNPSYFFGGTYSFFSGFLIKPD